MHCCRCQKVIAKGESHYGLHLSCFATWFGASADDEFCDLVRRDSHSQTPLKAPVHQTWNSSFFAGKFQKYSASLAGKQYILKLQQTEAPELPVVEFLCNQIARQLSLPVADHYLIQFLRHKTFVTRNMIDMFAENVALEHIYHFIADSKSFTCEAIIKAIQLQTNRYEDIEMFVRVCLFDTLIGNHDRHGRNLGFLVFHNQKQLAPAYDNVSALGLESGEILKAKFSPRGKIFTRDSREPVAKDYIKEFNRLGYQKIVTQFIQQIDFEKITKLIHTSACSRLMQKAILTLVTERYQEMCNALPTRHYAT